MHILVCVNLSDAIFSGVNSHSTNLRNGELKRHRFKYTVNLDGSKIHNSQKQFLIDSGIDIENIDFIDDGRDPTPIGSRAYNARIFFLCALRAFVVK